jgi:MFS transporter, DHA3 family, macrolide efflux protein
MKRESVMNGSSSLSSNSNFTRLWSARVVARFGSALGYVVLIWYVYAVTGSALAVVYVGLAEFVPTTGFGILSGALVDRYDRKRVIVLSTLGRSAAMGALVVALYLLGFDLLLIVLAAAVFSICATFFGPASQALLPEIVPREGLDKANGLFESSESIVAIAGSAAAGILVVAIGAIPSLGVDAASYLVGALFIALIGATVAAKKLPTGSESLAREVREGLTYLRRTRGLLQLTLVALVSNFLFSIVLTFLVVYTSNVLHGTALVYGGLEALLAAGWGDRRSLGRPAPTNALHRSSMDPLRFRRGLDNPRTDPSPECAGRLSAHARGWDLAGNPQRDLAEHGPSRSPSGTPGPISRDG